MLGRSAPELRCPGRNLRPRGPQRIPTPVRAAPASRLWVADDSLQARPAAAAVRLRGCSLAAYSGSFCENRGDVGAAVRALRQSVRPLTLDANRASKPQAPSAG